MKTQQRYTFFVILIEWLFSYAVYFICTDVLWMKDIYLFPLALSTFYVMISYLFSSYNDYFKKSRVSELLQSLVVGTFYFFVIYLGNRFSNFEIFQEGFSFWSLLGLIIFGHLAIRVILLNISKSLNLFPR